jgi:hypothetical protein
MHKLVLFEPIYATYDNAEINSTLVVAILMPQPLQVTPKPQGVLYSVFYNEYMYKLELSFVTYQLIMYNVLVLIWICDSQLLRNFTYNMLNILNGQAHLSDVDQTINHF